MGPTGASKAEKRARQMDYVLTTNYEKQLFLNSLSNYQAFTNKEEEKQAKRKSTKTTLQIVQQISEIIVPFMIKERNLAHM